jgi:hypothetical protein
MAIDINMRPTTILVGLLIVAAVAWASVYLAATLTQVLFLLVFIGILAILWGLGERAKKRLTGERRRGGR